MIRRHEKYFEKDHIYSIVDCVGSTLQLTKSWPQGRTYWRCLSLSLGSGSMWRRTDARATPSTSAVSAPPWSLHVTSSRRRSKKAKSNWQPSSSNARRQRNGWKGWNRKDKNKCVNFFYKWIGAVSGHFFSIFFLPASGQCLPDS